MQRKNYNVFVGTQKLVDVVYEYAQNEFNDILWLIDQRDNEVDPFCLQTQRGFFLEFIEGHPLRLWTPWGTWQFASAGLGRWDDVFLPLLFARLGAIPYLHNISGVGNVYEVHKVDLLSLPHPILARKFDYTEYNVALTEWRNLRRLYKDRIIS